MDYVYAVMTNPAIAVSGEAEAERPSLDVTSSSICPFARPLPAVRVGDITGLLELIHEQGDGMQQKVNSSFRCDFFLDIWDDYFPTEQAERQLATDMDWGHHAELFEIHSGEGRLTLPS